MRLLLDALRKRQTGNDVPAALRDRVCLARAKALPRRVLVRRALLHRLLFHVNQSFPLFFISFFADPQNSVL